MEENRVERMPVLFVGHGSPMNAIEDNRWSKGFMSLAGLFGRPRAVLAISAHWWVPGAYVTADERPRTIHDFGGFPDELYRVKYPAPGSPALAVRAASLAGRTEAVADEWGLDHGTWSVLRRMYPAADIPVVQLSIDRRAPPAAHAELGRRLSPLRDEGVLIFASGNIVHNLPYVFSRYGEGEDATPAWAARFDADTARSLERMDLGALTDALATPDGRMSHPTPDHYLPLLYAAGAAGQGERAVFPIEGFDMGSLSMRAVLIG